MYYEKSITKTKTLINFRLYEKAMSHSSFTVISLQKYFAEWLNQALFEPAGNHYLKIFKDILRQYSVLSHNPSPHVSKPLH